MIWYEFSWTLGGRAWRLNGGLGASISPPNPDEHADQYHIQKHGALPISGAEILKD